MMKKLLTLSATATILLSGHAFAATASLAQTTLVKPDHCPALANNITVQLSNNVMAGFNCGQSSFVVATCHITGTNKPQSVQAQYDVNNNLLPGYTGCAANNAGVTMCSFNGRLAFRGSSAGGSVSGTGLGDLTCTTTNIMTMVPDSMITGMNDTSATTQP